ncbi:MAG: EthD family reductase, partial [Anaerolineae bacterium]|nr:EthD family reductase [Anaerolineae bacterium]
MVRLLVLYSQPSDIDAFERHYHDVHIPLVKQLAGLKRYTISRNVTAMRGD